MFKKNIKIYSIVSLILFSEMLLFYIIMKAGYKAGVYDLPRLFIKLIPPIILAFIFQLISLKFQKENVIKTLKVILNTFAVIYYLYWQYSVIMFMLTVIFLEYFAE